MPKLKKLGGVTLRALSHSNGLAESSASRVPRSQWSFMGTLTEALEAQLLPRITPEVIVGRSAFRVVWNGRDSLTSWPECDWAVLLRDGYGYEPVWDRPPQTSSMWLAKRIIRERESIGEQPVSVAEGEFDEAWRALIASGRVVTGQRKTEAHVRIVAKQPERPKPVRRVSRASVRLERVFDSVRIARQQLAQLGL